MLLRVPEPDPPGGEGVQARRNGGSVPGDRPPGFGSGIRGCAGRWRRWRPRPAVPTAARLGPAPPGPRSGRGGDSRGPSVRRWRDPADRAPGPRSRRGPICRARGISRSDARGAPGFGLPSAPRSRTYGRTPRPGIAGRPRARPRPRSRRCRPPSRATPARADTCAAYRPSPARATNTLPGNAPSDAGARGGRASGPARDRPSACRERSRETPRSPVPRAARACGGTPGTAARGGADGPGAGPVRRSKRFRSPRRSALRASRTRMRSTSARKTGGSADPARASASFASGAITPRRRKIASPRAPNGPGPAVGRSLPARGGAPARPRMNDRRRRRKRWNVCSG